jgi:hypothetical protein
LHFSSFSNVRWQVRQIRQVRHVRQVRWICFAQNFRHENNNYQSKETSYLVSLFCNLFSCHWNWFKNCVSQKKLWVLGKKHLRWKKRVAGKTWIFSGPHLRLGWEKDGVVWSNNVLSKFGGHSFEKRSFDISGSFLQIYHLT